MSIENNSSNPENGVELESVWDDEKSQIEYALPLPRSAAPSGKELIQDIPEEELKQIGDFIIAPSPETHHDQFKQALDFLVKDGTKILACADGVIENFTIIQTEWGNDPSFASKMNYITLKHISENGQVEYTQYCHLAKDSIPLNLQVGDKVRRGQVIGIVGKTGWTDRDHLHYICFRVPKPDDNPLVIEKGFKSLVPNFKLKENFTIRKIFKR